MAEMVIQASRQVYRSGVEPNSSTLSSSRPGTPSASPTFPKPSDSLETKPAGQKRPLEKKAEPPDVNSTEKEQRQVPGRYQGLSEPLPLGPDEETSVLTRRYDASGKLLPAEAKAVELFQQRRRGINILA